MKQTHPQASGSRAARAPKERLTPRERLLLMMVAQLMVLICILLAATASGLSWQWTLLLAIAPVIGGALLSQIWGKLPR